jgi:transposase
VVRQLLAVETLRRMWVQQFVIVDGAVRLREADNLPPARVRMTSPYDPVELTRFRGHLNPWEGTS